ncbi:MAG: carotenoid biosynthesis protein [Actinomycetota bacterium]|nr:carotenoid biosynthesis protein [Actinomycetota bacterium]
MIVVRTVVMRWYAFAFVAGLVWSAWPEGGWRRALRFLIVSFAVTFAGEYASTHSSIPYGHYSYTTTTRGRELYLSNVPLFVPVAFGSVIWAGRSLAAATRPARSRIGLAFAGAVFATALDFIIDPMTVRGHRWFLGSLYEYGSRGPYFGIPWSNFAGWLLVAFVVIGLDAALASGTHAGVEEESARRGRILAFAICTFFIIVAAATALWSIAIAGFAITAVLVAADIRRHL